MPIAAHVRARIQLKCRAEQTKRQSMQSISELLNKLVSQFSGQCTDTERKGMSTLNKQWHYCDVMSGPRTNINCICGYG
jgi:hypothetical protein